MQFNELAPIISLDGAWEFELAGQSGALTVPGTWEAQGFPRRVDGPAVFRKTFTIPPDWQGKRIELQFDAVSYHAEISLNDHALGTHTGLWTSFAFDVTDSIHLGSENIITLTVYKPGEKFPMRESLAGFLPDVSIPFGGIWQSARLVAFEGSSISNLHIASDPVTGSVKVSGNVSHAVSGKLVVGVHDDFGSVIDIWVTTAIGSEFKAEIKVNDAKLWSPTAPNLYEILIRTYNEDGVETTRVRRTFGFRSLSRAGEQLILNGQPVSLRGALNWGWYPEILCPAPDEATIRDEFRRVREFGYNMVKLCLYVPSPLYFEIADEEGMLLWLELPLWLPHVSDHLRNQIGIEYRDILARVHHHPSIIIYSLGCELGHSVESDLLDQLNTLLRGSVNDVLVCDNSGSGEAYGGLTFDFSDFNDYHFYCDLHNFDPLVDHFHRDWRTARPWIFGEFCDADDFRDVEEIAAANGGELPWWLTEKNPIHSINVMAYHEQRERMGQLDLGFTYQDLQRISRQQSFIIRKTILEKVRRRAGMGGYVVTGLRDTPLATSSMFDDLTRPKYDAADFRQFNADTVLLLEQGRARVWKNGGDRPAPVDRQNRLSGELLDFRIVLSQTGNALPAGELHWELFGENLQPVQNGHYPITVTAPAGTPHEIARLTFSPPEVTTPQEYTLGVDLGAIHNHWSVWIYPAVTVWPDNLVIYDPSGSLTMLDDLFDSAENITRQPDFTKLADKILITSAFTPQVISFIESGGHALVLQTGAGSLPVRPCPFWRESIKLLYDHPIMNAFPHRGYTDLQFYNLATDYALDAAAIHRDIPQISAVKPLIRRLDARLFSVHEYLVELELGAGKILASTLRFAGGAGDQVGSLKTNTAGRYLLQQILAYLSDF